MSDPMKSISGMFSDPRYQAPPPTAKKDRRTQRGELMREFMSYLNPDRRRDGLSPLGFPRMGKILEKIPTEDLYYLLRVCKDSANFSKRFWWELDPKKHETP